MTAILEYLDQLAFAALVILSNWIGTPQIPAEPDPDWQVVQSWTELPDKTYQMQLQSNTIGSYCAENPSHFILFPQTYMGQYEIYVDNRLIATNSISEKWVVVSMFSNTPVRCDQIKNAKSVDLKLSSYIKYFSILSSFPSKKIQLGFLHYIAKYIYAISGVICLLLGLLGGISLFKMIDIEKIFSYIAEDLFFLILSIAVYSDLLGGIDMRYAHIGVGLGMWGGLIFFFNHVIAPENIFIKYVWLTVLILLFLFAYEKRNLVQLYIYLPIIPCAILLGQITVKDFFRFDKKYSEKLIQFIIFILGLLSAYYSVIERSGILSLALFIIFISIFKFVKIQDVLNLIFLDRESIRIKLSSEKQYSNKLFYQQERYREILHDIKSPISSLAMLIGFQHGKSKTILEKIHSQFLLVISKAENDKDVNSIKWYSTALLVSKINESMNLYREIYRDINFSLILHELNSEYLVACDPVDMHLIFSELIANSLKYANSLSSIIINLQISEERDFLIIKYQDIGLGPVNIDIKMLGERGYTVSGSGTGLSSIKNKITDWGGFISFNYNSLSNGLLCEIRLRVEIKDNKS